MDSNKIISAILKLDESSSVKNTLVALYVQNRPMTVASLNSALNLSKTWENYNILLKDMMEKGFVSIIEAKDYRSVMRKHFLLNLEAVLDTIEE
jgi:predicted transcriptional regulator